MMLPNAGRLKPKLMVKEERSTSKSVQLTGHLTPAGGSCNLKPGKFRLKIKHPFKIIR